MLYTSSEMNKTLRDLNNRLNEQKQMESRCTVFNAAVGEDPETLRPAYNYEETRETLDELETKIRKAKHALNVFNSTTPVDETGMTIDEALIYLPQLTAKMNRLCIMAMRLPRERDLSNRNSNIIDYKYVNYDITTVKADYEAVKAELTRLQLAIDKVNNTVQFEFDF